MTITVSDELSAELEPYREQLDQLLRIGLRELKMEQSLLLYRQGHVSLWKAARLAGVGLREMIQYAAAQGLQPETDEETIAEELV